MVACCGADAHNLYESHLIVISLPLREKHMSNNMAVPSAGALENTPIAVETATLGINQFTSAELEAFLLQFARNAGMFSLVLVKENGQGYNAVVHHGGLHPKVRLALMSDDRSMISSSWNVRDMIERLFSDGVFPADIERTVNRTLQGLDGSVMLKIAQVDRNGDVVRYEPSGSAIPIPLTRPTGFRITKAIWHEDNIWP
jgi:hypothetical protein